MSCWPDSRRSSRSRCRGLPSAGTRGMQCGAARCQALLTRDLLAWIGAWEKTGLNRGSQIRMSDFGVPARYNVASDLLARNLEVGRGRKVAIHHAGGEVTYDHLYALVCGAAAELRENGVRREERVLLCAYDSPGWV